MSISATTARPSSRRPIATALLGVVAVLSVAAALVATAALNGARDEAPRTVPAIHPAAAGPAVAVMPPTDATGVPDASLVLGSPAPAEDEPTPTF